MIDIDHLVALLDENALTHIEYEPGDGSRVVIKREAEKAPAATVVAVPTATEQGGAQIAPGGEVSLDAGAAGDRGRSPLQSAPQSGTTVTAPLVGVVYLRKEPGEPKFVELNKTVKAGDVLCLIEAMKMFSEITAPVDGVVTAISIADGDLAEYGAPLFTIEQLGQ